MVNVSKKYPDAALKDRAWKIILLNDLKTCYSGEKLEKLMSHWLSEKEIMMLEKRLAIKALLISGVCHNEIKRILDVSSHTITAVKTKIKKD